MTDRSFEEWVAIAIDKGHNDQKAVAQFLRGRGLKFSAAKLRSAWKAVWVQPALEPAQGQPVAEPEDLPAPVKPLIGGRVKSPDAYRPRLAGDRFVFTCAQNNTDVHPQFWETLQTFCAHNNAQLGVAKISYNKGGWQKHGGISKNKSVGLEDEGLWYDPKIIPFEIYQQVKVADGLVFCGELDILPTAIYPLNGLDNYTGMHSAIVPHVKMQMQSFATMKHDPAKLLYTTGACTLRNYIQRRSGQIAEYNHVYGAVYVEVDSDGDWFVRQLNADDDGIVFDLEMAYGPGWVCPASDFGKPAINLGDIHVEKLDEVAWQGAREMLRQLDPSHVFIEDLIDFEPRNHHNKKDPHFLAYQNKFGLSVKGGMLMGWDFMNALADQFPEAKIISVRSNHDQAILRWLKEPPELGDPNTEYWHWLNYNALASIREHGVFDAFRFAMDDIGPAKPNIRYLQEDESFVLRGIEFGMHGHLGPNGARGNPKAYRQIGRRANTGHTHSAGIIDGIYTAGVLATLNMGYNLGPSSWSQSHIVTYPNGKRTIVTQKGRKWRAVNMA